MGAADSKLKFKSHIFRLTEVPNIPKDDPYWTQVRGLFYRNKLG